MDVKYVTLIYCLLAAALFVAQTILCFRSKNPVLRLMPTLFALGVMLVQTVRGFFSLDSAWHPLLIIPYLFSTAVVPVIGAGLGWTAYVIRLMAQTVSEFRRSR